MALQICYDTLALDSDYDDCKELLGQTYMDMKRFKESEEIFLEILNSNPENADVLARYGLLMLKSGFEEKAISLLKESLRIDPDNNLSLRYYFLHKLSKNKKKEKLESLITYLDSEDNEISRMVHIGLSDYFNKDYKKARENIRQAFLLDPTNIELLEFLEELDREANIIFVPINFVERIGGPFVIWFSFIAFIMLFTYLDLQYPLMVVTATYILYVIYSWTVYPLYKLLSKFKRGF